MKPIEELRAAHAATTQGEWNFYDSASSGDTNVVIFTGEEGGDGIPHEQLISDSWISDVGTDLIANAAFIALAHNEFPALLDEIETLRRKLAQWESVFGHLGDTPDECGNAINAKYEEYEERLEALKAPARDVVDNWENSDLASAVRRLSAALDEDWGGPDLEN